MNIVIFDDDMSFIGLMKKLMNEFNKKHNGIFAEPTYINNVEDIIAYVDANQENASLYFLDIMADNEPVGFAIAEHIKRVNEGNIIFYVTDYKDQILTDDIEYKLLALSFIGKESKKFSIELERAILKAQELFKEDYFIGECFTRIIRVKYEDLFYFKKNKHGYDITVVHKNGSDVISGNLKDLINELNSHFVYASRELIVNTQAILRIEKEDRIIFFEKGRQCTYSIRRGKDLFDKCRLSLQ